ncbi:MAG: C4-type zinc ribbon domain-containing protein [Nitrospirota bacterium]
MKEQLERLIQLQQIDSKILDKKRMVDEIPSKISVAEVPFKESLTALGKMKQRHEALERKKRDKERRLDDINEKIKKLKARTAEIKTNKEYQAHLREIESAEKERYAVEDEILIVMEEVDASSKEIKLQEIKIGVEKDKIEAFKKKLEREMLEAEKELLTLKEARSRIVVVIDEELYNQYITLIEAGNGVVVTEAKEAVCQGCNMNIPPQLFVEIKKNEEIIHCPQCYRILYYKNKF